MLRFRDPEYDIYTTLHLRQSDYTLEILEKLNFYKDKNSGALSATEIR